MTETEIIDALDRLSALHKAAAEMSSELMARKHATIPADVQERLAAIDNELQPQIEAIEKAIDAADTAVRAAVLAHGATIKATSLMAVYARGRVSWDTKGLDGFAVAHPELLQLRREGEPSVSIRASK